MNEIEVIIKMPEEQYNTIKSDLYNTFPAEMRKWGLEAIRNGTPLPKGHGDLIDRQELLKSPLCKTFGLRSVDIENAPTIIEADKEEQNADSD